MDLFALLTCRPGVSLKMFSVSKLADLAADAVVSARKRHVHELGLRVHLKAAHDRLVDLVVDSELLAFVLGVSLQGRYNLRLLVCGKFSGGDDGDLLLLVELLVQLGVLLGDVVDLVQTLVLGQDGQETHGGFAEGSRLLERGVKLGDLFAADATILGEQTELLAVSVDLLHEAQVLVHVVQIAVLRSCGEKHARVAALNGVLLGGWLVIWGRFNNLDVSDREGLEEGSVEWIHSRSSSGWLGCWLGLGGGCGLWHGLWLRGLLNLVGRRIFVSGARFLSVREEASWGVVERHAGGSLRSGEDLLDATLLEGLEESASDHFLLLLYYN